MTQLELPPCSTFVVRVQATIDLTIPAESGKAAKKYVEEHVFPKLSRPKIMAVYRSDMMPAAEENEGGDDPEPPWTPPRGRPNPGGTQGGGSTKPIPKPADAVAA